MIWPALRDWLVILASVPKSLTLVLQSKTSKETGTRRRPWRQRESFGLVLRGALRETWLKKFFVEWVFNMETRTWGFEIGTVRGGDVIICQNRRAKSHHVSFLIISQTPAFVSPSRKLGGFFESRLYQYSWNSEFEEIFPHVFVISIDYSHIF